MKDLMGEDWATRLKPAINSLEFARIRHFLQELLSHKIQITPDPKHVFRAFKECPYKDLHTVFIGLDPYPGLVNNRRVADGIAFSSHNSVNQPPKSLQFMYQALEEDFGVVMDRADNDLTYLANQGFLFLNSALTTEIGKTGAHLEYWRPFMAKVLKYINDSNTGLIFVFMGKEGQKFMPIINDKRHYKLKVSHPASAAYTGEAWNHKSIFKEVARLIKENYNTKIKLRTL